MQRFLRTIFSLWVWIGTAWGAIEINDFSGLNTPFNEMSAGTYVQTTDWLYGDTFFSQRKVDVVLNEMDDALERITSLEFPGDGRNILEIGTGRGYLTTQIMDHLYEKRISNPTPSYLVNDVNGPDGQPYGGTVLFTIDNWQARESETISTHNITIPLRQVVGSDPLNGFVAETDVQQMISNILHRATAVGGDSTIGRNSYLDMVRLAYKSPLTVGSGTAYVAANTIDPFYDPVLRDTDLVELKNTYNDGNPFAMIIIDTDTRSATDFRDLLLRCYNVLGLGGAILMDDVCWAHRAATNSYPILGGLQSYYDLVQDSLFNGGLGFDRTFTNPQVIDLTDGVAGGQEIISYPEGVPEVVETGFEVMDQGNVYFSTYHTIWNEAQAWIAIERKGSTQNGTYTPIPYPDEPS